ncbi:hypothetical protein KEJ37_06815 [Candidatus Bathyarchaeota archaeon]|nr:hypothetical protein [Candidatus Bathyarchaeota archaeon]
MEYSREDLLKLVSNLDSEVFDWLPSGKPRTIRNCLRHTACVEPWYITRLDVELPTRYPRNVFKLLTTPEKLLLLFKRHAKGQNVRGFSSLERTKARCATSGPPERF